MKLFLDVQTISRIFSISGIKYSEFGVHKESVKAITGDLLIWNYYSPLNTMA
jgi:hypothetical protein